MLEFVIINYNTPELTCKCIKSIYDTYSSDSRIIVVDNASSDNSPQKIAVIYPEVKIIVNSQNFGYAKAVNIGVFNTDSEFVIVSNSDIEYHEGSLRILENMMIDNPNIGIGGFYQFFPDGNPQRSFGYRPGYKNAIYEATLYLRLIEKLHYLIRKLRLNRTDPFEVEYIDGASLLVRKSVFNKLNGFDEDYFFYSEETDYCKRVSDLGYGVVINPQATITHLRGGSSGSSTVSAKSLRLLFDSKDLYLRKHGSNFEIIFSKYSTILFFTNLKIISRIMIILTTGLSRTKWQTTNNTYNLIIKILREQRIEL